MDPFIVMEYYLGWVDFEDHWHEIMDSQEFAKGVDKILSYNGSKNFHMEFGGTNFQFKNGW